jgi:hypothetical protein
MRKSIIFLLTILLSGCASSQENMFDYTPSYHPPREDPVDKIDHKGRRPEVVFEHGWGWEIYYAGLGGSACYSTKGEKIDCYRNKDGEIVPFKKLPPQPKTTSQEKDGAGSFFEPSERNAKTPGHCDPAYEDGCSDEEIKDYCEYSPEAMDDSRCH